MNKIHLMRLVVSPEGVRTSFCGKKGWPAQTTGSEFETVIGERFEGQDDRKGVTCKSCLRRSQGRPMVGTPERYGP